MNQVNKTAAGKVREENLIMNTRKMSLTLKTTQMMPLLLLSLQTRNMQTSGQLQHAQDEQQRKEPFYFSFF